MTNGMLDFEDIQQLAKDISERYSIELAPARLVIVVTATGRYFHWYVAIYEPDGTSCNSWLRAFDPAKYNKLDLEYSMVDEVFNIIKHYERESNASNDQTRTDPGND